MSGTLIFKARDVARLIVHAVEAEKHTATWTTLLHEGARREGVNLDDVDFKEWDRLVQVAKDSDFDPEPALNFVHDQGIYLMSNGKPQLADDDPGRVIYAEGFDPSKESFDDWWEGARAIVGGDDFVEPLPLDARLIRMARAFASFTTNPPAFYVEVTEESFTFGFDLDLAKPK